MTVACVMIAAGLFVAPARATATAPDAPQWVGAPTRVDRRTIQLSVAGPPRSTPGQAQAEAVVEAGRRLRALDLVWGDAQVRELFARPATVRRLIDKSYTEVRERDYGTTFRTHLLVRIDPNERRRLEREASSLRRQHGGRWIARAMLMGMVLLAVSVFYTHLDRATRGYASGRLRLAAGAILAASAYGIWHLV